MLEKKVPKMLPLDGNQNVSTLWDGIGFFENHLALGTFFSDHIERKCTLYQIFNYLSFYLINYFKFLLLRAVG